jgi:hypothetical protein
VTAEELNKALDAANLAVGSYIRTAQGMRCGDEASVVVWLERALTSAKSAAELRVQLTATYVPCEKCNRRVPSPCNNLEGLMTQGPWDGSCDMFFHPGRYE